MLLSMMFRPPKMWYRGNSLSNPLNMAVSCSVPGLSIVNMLNAQLVARATTVAHDITNDEANLLLFLSFHEDAHDGSPLGY